MIWFIIIAFLMYLLGFTLTKIFIKKDKFIYFCLLSWLIFSIVSFIAVCYIFPEKAGECCQDERLFLFSELAIEPTHHILFVIALIMLGVKIVKKYKEKKN